MLRPASLALLLAILLAPTSTNAADRPRGVGVRLDYERGPGARQCPDARLLRGEVAAEIGTDPFTETGPWRLRAAVTRKKNGAFVATAELFDGDGGSVDSMGEQSARDCRALVLIKVQLWFTAHRVTVRRALAWFGVTDREDRAELTQDVFFSAYLALVRGEQIEHPHAWLRESARKHASNYHHKQRRRSPHIGGDPLVHGKDPEQITSARERLNQALAGLTEDAKDIVFDIRVEGVSWAKAAQERGVTIDQARYMYQRALSQMETSAPRDDRSND